MTTIPQRHRHTDVQTDGRTDNLPWQYRAIGLCVPSRGKKKSLKECKPPPGRHGAISNVNHVTTHSIRDMPLPVVGPLELRPYL